jgi:large subunit ribosomal protein L25
MARDITVVAEKRESGGKNVARRLRAGGKTPGVVYGTGGQTVEVSVNPKEINKILHSKSGHNTIFNLAIQGSESSPVMIVDWQSDPIKDYLLHVDLKRIDLTKRITVKVPVYTTGEPKGVKQQGGLLEIVTREIELECLPDEIPESLHVEVGELMIGQSVRAGEVPLTGSSVLTSPKDQVIAHVVVLKAEEVAATPAEGAEAAAAPAEPEVIKKGKKEEEAVPEEKEKKK